MYTVYLYNVHVHCTGVKLNIHVHVPQVTINCVAFYDVHVCAFSVTYSQNLSLITINNFTYQ